MIRMRAMVTFVAFVGLSSCGGIAASENGAAGPERDAKADAPAEYSGLFRARVASYEGNLGHLLDISFWQGPRSASALSCGSNPVTLGNCCVGNIVVALPILPPVP